MQYKVLSRENEIYSFALEELEKEVQKLIKIGWIPQGGVSVTSFTIDITHHLVAQAMVKED